MAFLRALTLLGLTESIFYRLLPDPGAGPAPDLLRRMHASLSFAGSLTFFPAFFFVVMALLVVASRSLRLRFWPPGLNGVLTLCLLGVAILGFSAVATSRGPVFAIAFTALSVVTLLLMAMHAYSATASGWEKVFAVAYGAAMVCSALATVLRFAADMPKEGLARGTVDRFAGLSEPGLSAGTLFLSAAGAAAFMAFHEVRRSEVGAGARRIAAMVLSIAPSLAFAAGCLVAPPELALIGPDPAPISVLLLSCALFFGLLAALTALMGERSKGRGYGLLLLVLAGFPLRIAYQDMLMVLGAALVFAPDAACEPAARPVPVDLPAGLS
jgi:hypothetical protein